MYILILTYLSAFFPLLKIFNFLCRLKSLQDLVGMDLRQMCNVPVNPVSLLSGK